MPVSPGLTTKVASGNCYFRVTSPSFNTTNSADHHKVVNGQGGVNSRVGARYNFPGVLTIYLTDDLKTCFAEKMFYFHREILRGIDIYHHTGVIPPFQKDFVLWKIEFYKDVTDVFDMTISGAHSHFNVFPSLTVNPSQDYEHLKTKRAEIQSSGYRGLRVQSSRARSGGNLIVLFQDQSNNVQRITPQQVEFRLITSTGSPFSNHGYEILNFTAGEVRMSPSANWQRVDFNH